jgi:hypothetical protein
MVEGDDRVFCPAFFQEAFAEAGMIAVQLWSQIHTCS